MWPCQTILNDSYKLDDLGEEGTWRYSDFAYYTMKAFDPNISDYPFIILSGPYKDKMNYRYPTCSFNTLLVMNKQFVGIMQIEIRSSYFYYEIFKNLTFLNTGYTIFFNLFAQIIAPAPTWTEVNPMNVTQNLFDVYSRTGITEKYFYDNLFNKTKNSDELRLVSILNEFYDYTDYYESTVLLPYNFEEATVKIILFFLILMFFIVLIV
ncbi:MAG: hypothetical protein KDC72_09380 [Bacteroidetes bacterium]|nr:hypothetical protein [Bacteroidota bacterium]